LRTCLFVFLQVTRAAQDPGGSLDLKVQADSRVCKELLEFQVTLDELDLEDRQGSLEDLEIPEEGVCRVRQAYKAFQAIPESRVLLVILEHLEILALRVDVGSMVHRVALASRDLVATLDSLARVDRKDKLAVQGHRASEEIKDLVDQLERLEILVSNSFRDSISCFRILCFVCVERTIT